MDYKTGEIGILKSIAIFGFFAIILLLETHFLIPFLSKTTGLEPIIFWFLVAGLGLFLPMLFVAFFMLKNEGLSITRDVWSNRLRFRPMIKNDWLWSIGAVIVIGISSIIIIKILEQMVGKVESQPAFMYFEPLTPGRYWILLLWMPYWILNILGEEILWRGVILPKQEIAFGSRAWYIHGLLWGMFHLAFGWQLLLTLIPVLFIQSFVVQRRKNSWIGVVIHGVINGPSFLAISFGLL